MLRHVYVSMCVVYYSVIVTAVCVCVFLVPGSGMDLSVLTITFSMIGKFGISAAFGAVFLYAPELFPTTVR